MTTKRSQQPNKFVVKKGKPNNRVKPIFPIPLWLASLLNKLRRNKLGSLKGFKISRIFKSIFQKRKKLYLTSIAILFIAVMLSLSIYFKIRYDQIQVVSLSENEDKIANLYNNKTQNVLFVNFKEESDGNQFAKYLSILSFNKTNNTLKILAVEPVLNVYYKNKSYTLETLFNVINENEETKMQVYIDSIESLLGVRIDAYIVTNNEKYAEFIAANNFSMNLNENFKLDNKFYKSGQSISGEDLLAYLHIKESSEEVESTLYRNNLFVTNMLQSNRNIIFSINSFFNSKLFTQTFNTNLDKNSALRFYNDIFTQSNLPIQSQYILRKDGYLIDTFAGKGLFVNQIDIDNKVQEVFRDLDIVREQAKIEVLNASRTSGLATVNKKIIQNSGGNVVNSGNFPTLEDKPILYLIDVNLTDYANTISLIKSLYPEVEIKEGGYKYNKLGNLILVIGSKEE